MLLSERLSNLSIREIIDRSIARLVAPLQARLLGSAALQKVILNHLDSGKITVAGRLCDIGLDRFESDFGFRALKAKYHVARSEWQEALTVFGGVENLTDDSSKLIAAEVFANLKRPYEALKILEHVSSAEALERKVQLALQLRDSPKLSDGLCALMELQPRDPAPIIFDIIRHPYFRYYLRHSSYPELKQIVFALNDTSVLSFIIHLELAHWRSVSVRLWKDFAPSPNDQDLAKDVLTALATRLVKQKRLVEQKVNYGAPAQFDYSGWVDSVWPWLQGRQLVTTMRRLNLSHVLRGEMASTNHPSQLLTQNARRLLIFDDAIHQLKTAPDTDLENQAHALLHEIINDDGVSLDDLSSVLHEAVSFFGVGAMKAHVKQATETFTHKTSVKNADRFLQSFSWLDAYDDFRPLYAVPALRSARHVLKVTQILEANRALDYIDRTFEKFPAEFSLFRRAILLAVKTDNLDLTQAYMRKAEKSSAISPENLARLRLDAENYELADKQMEACEQNLSQTALQEWVRSLIKRGNISSALKKTATDHSGLQSELHKIKTSLDNLIKANHLSPDEADALESPDKLVPILAKIAAPIHRSSRGITMVSSTLRPGGAERQVLATIKGLMRILPESTHLELYCRSLAPNIQADFFLSEIEQSGVQVFELAQAHPQKGDTSEALALLELLPPELKEIALPLIKAFSNKRPEICHLWQDRIALAGIIAAILSGVPRIIVSLRSTRPDARRRFRPYQQNLYKSLLKAFPQRIVLLNNSHYGARDYETWLNMDAGAISCVHNGFDIEAITERTKLPSSVNFDTTENMNSTSVCLGWVGRFTFEKRPEVWVETAIKLSQKIPNFRAIAAGNGPAYSKLQTRVAEAGLSDKIKFLGVQRPIEPIMKSMDVLLLTSEREGLPNVLVEAQAVGVPVITVDVGGASEAVNSGVTGLVIADRGDALLVDDLVEAVMTLLNDRAKRQNMSKAAPAWVKTEFSLETMVRKTLHAYYPKSDFSSSQRDTLS